MSLTLRLATFGITLAVLAAGMGTLAAEHNSHRYPPPFPRKLATKVLENKRVVVWDVTWPKGFQSSMHEHYMDHISITLRGGKEKSTNVHGVSHVTTYKVGSVVYTPKGGIHEVEGVSEVPRRAIIIQLKSCPKSPAAPQATD